LLLTSVGYFLSVFCVVIKAKEEKKELSRDDKKRLLKQRKEMLKNGDDTYEIDQMLGL